jgi:hypothetical protein
MQPNILDLMTIRLKRCTTRKFEFFKLFVTKKERKDPSIFRKKELYSPFCRKQHYRFSVETYSLEKEKTNSKSKRERFFLRIRAYEYKLLLGHSWIYNLCKLSTHISILISFQLLSLLPLIKDITGKIICSLTLKINIGFSLSCNSVHLSMYHYLLSL